MNAVDSTACCLVRYLKAAELFFLRTWLTGIEEMQKLVVPNSHLIYSEFSPSLSKIHTNDKHQNKSYPLPTPNSAAPKVWRNTGWLYP